MDTLTLIVAIVAAIIATLSLIGNWWQYRNRNKEDRLTRMETKVDKVQDTVNKHTSNDNRLEEKVSNLEKGQERLHTTVEGYFQTIIGRLP